MGAMDGLSRAWPAPTGDDHLVGAPHGRDGHAPDSPFFSVSSWRWQVPSEPLNRCIGVGDKVP